ncbi:MULTISPECIES: hypothetical protein [unclassified Azospirillum]|uniref:hypothetical protein n=1 Tax=unclassified Azospirillum TaxID=2630922 RepID=UPI000B71279C|nr:MULTISPECIES: hypothetical protein [unclassified Azospirillum]SNS44726.1 hypothetical protein SAMN05880556_10520 [Azospirillum sp. RU38E]SNS63586.1 hypothetical protein SAMN05880591_10520 [Azospirillum sp. RU37A]
MAAGDAFTGPQPVGPIAGSAGVGGVAGPLVRPLPSLPVQATILSRPPDLPSVGITQLAGTIGAALPDGEVPLATSLGTVLLRPLPGAWPADLAPGSSVNITLGPGARAGNLEVTGRPPAAAAATGADGHAVNPPVTSTKPLDNAAVLRGLLAGANGTSPQQPVIPGLRASPAAVLAAGTAGQPMPTAPQTASLSAASGALLSSAGSNQPRPLAAAIQAPGPAAAPPASLAQSPQAVAQVAPDSGPATQDLLRHATPQAPLAGGGKAALPPGMAAPLADDLVVDKGKTDSAPAAPRADQALAAALAQPGMMARMAAFMPRPDRLGGLALMLYLFGARNGGVRAWLGDDQLQHVTKGEAAALAELDQAMVPVTRLAGDGQGWTSLLVPFMEGDKPSVFLLATLGGLVVPVERDRPGQDQPARETGEEGPPTLPASAFTLGVHLSELGAVQVQGLCLPGRLSLEITIAALPEPPDRDAFAERLQIALARVEPGSHVRLRWGHPPLVPDLMPGGAQPVMERRV